MTIVGQGLPYNKLYINIKTNVQFFFFFLTNDSIHSIYLSQGCGAGPWDEMANQAVCRLYPADRNNLGITN